MIVSSDASSLPTMAPGADGGDSEFSGIRAHGGKGGRGPLDGGGGGEVIYGRMNVTPGVTYNVTVGQGGKGTMSELSSNGLVGKGGDGTSGMVIIRYRTDGTTDNVEETTAMKEMIEEANKAFSLKNKPR